MAIDAATYRLAMTGYVEQGAGSVASANAVVLRRLLEKCCEILFFSKPDFVDPRPMVEETDHKERFVYVDTTGPVVGPGRTPSGARQANVNALLRPLTRRLEPSFHRRRVNRRMVQVFAGANSPDACLWLGLPASGAVPGAPTVSWLQGPPGTDARSIERHADEIRQLGGRALLWKLRAYAAWRLGAGLPRYEHSDALVVGSEWSRRTMTDHYGVRPDRLHAIPYPIDLETFRPPSQPRPTDGSLRVLWLGRIVPRKRLDVFLKGLETAIRQGVDVRGTVVGGSGFVPNYERWIEAFPFRDRLEHNARIDRSDVPALMGEHDVLAQPSDEENFGSSVAEAQACGMPVVVGATNGTGDNVCDRSIRLTDDSPEAFAAALARLAEDKRSGALSDPTPSRRCAEHHFDPVMVTDKLLQVVHDAIQRQAL